MAPNFKMARCLSNNKVSSTYQDLVFETSEEINFLPGQYLTCKVAEARLNSYSIAGRVGEKKFGFIIDTKPGGPGSQYFAKLQVGEEMPYLGPFGKFVLNLDDGAEEFIFLGTGSGVAPLKAMLEVAFNKGVDKKMVLYFGLRYREDIFWDEYFNHLQELHKNFRFVLCLSKPDEVWQGVSGHITDLIRKEYSSLKHASAYLCGGLKMIEEAKEVLQEMEMPVERIYHEKFF